VGIAESLVKLAGPQLVQGLDVVRDQLNALNAHLAAIGENTAAIGSRLAAIDQGITALHVRQNGTDKRLATVETKLEQIAAAQQVIFGEQAALMLAISQAGGRPTALLAQLASDIASSTTYNSTDPIPRTCPKCGAIGLMPCDLPGCGLPPPPPEEGVSHVPNSIAIRGD